MKAAIQQTFWIPGSVDLRRYQIKDAILSYKRHLRLFPPEDTSHLPEEVQLAFRQGKIARNGKAKLAEKALVCPACSTVYCNKAGLKIHREGTNKKDPTCPMASAYPFLPSLPHETDTRFCRTATPEFPEDPYRGRKFKVFTRRFSLD